MSKKYTLVLGASLNPDRYSNRALHRLCANNIEVKAFGLKKGTVCGVDIDTELMPYKNIHTVTLYLNPKRQEPYYDYILGLNPTRVIFNPGTENPEFYKLLSELSIDYEAACTLVLLSTHQY
ncbi:CoA-binding protein [Flavobacteriaceae bacterium]|nr:CoA-binding protein [Flavobacteriaceae bacterium]